MSDSLVESFPPQVGAQCRVLVLGTAPSVRSLAMQQSYAHPQNLFWPFMGELFDAGPELAYAQRIARLHALGVGIWDVYARCERPGSLDSSIVRASEIANDIPGLAAAHPELHTIVLNGGTAQKAFRRLVLPHLPAGRVALLDLPSTSPANASIPRARKRSGWEAMRDAVSNR
ncbi:DNA-deoxyinosine glycosylase [Dokdonella sp. MW10]|uniref:DNA-deoxyinosine glycosylase n=1 Tax=Dokdonella sp. MW10 TaxID=2992926 RepID=UPI003F81D935